MKAFLVSLLLITFSCSGPFQSGVGQGGSTETTSSTDPTQQSNYETCTGTTTDGEANLNNPNGAILSPLIQYNLTLSGGKSWMPGNPPQAPSADFVNPIPTLEEGFVVFETDGGYHIRLKVNDQPIPANGTKHCYDRALSQSPDVERYKKLKWNIHAHAVVRKLNAEGNFEYTRVPAQQFIGTFGPINNNECSPIIFIPALNVVGEQEENVSTILEISEVRNDKWCQAGIDDGFHCPAERMTRQADCWSMTLQVSTDRTVDFKGQN